MISKMQYIKIKPVSFKTYRLFYCSSV